jgi:hypothetical protein
MIQIGDIVKLRLTNQYGIVIKQESNNGYIVDWFTLTVQEDTLLYQAFHLIKVSQ